MTKQIGLEDWRRLAVVGVVAGVHVAPVIHDAAQATALHVVEHHVFRQSRQARHCQNIPQHGADQRMQLSSSVCDVRLSR